MGFKQAKKAYKLKNPDKYIGDPNKLLYKSSWEQHTFLVCDSNPNIVRWGYEIIKIKYAKPYGNGFRITYYYPDLYLEYFDKDMNFIKEVMEVKPKSQTQKSKSKNVKTRLYENYVHEVNQAKWAAAEVWCHKRGIRFSVITENGLYGTKRNK